MADRDANGDEWTVGTVRKYLEAQITGLREIIEANDKRYTERFQGLIDTFAQAIAAVKEAVTTALATAERANTKAENANDKRFEGVNEFRNSLSDQSRLLMPRLEVEALFRGLKEDIGKLEKSQQSTAGRSSGVRDSWAVLAAIAALLISIGSVVVLAVHR